MMVDPGSRKVKIKELEINGSKKACLRYKKNLCFDFVINMNFRFNKSFRR